MESWGGGGLCHAVIGSLLCLSIENLVLYDIIFVCCVKALIKKNRQNLHDIVWDFFGKKGLEKMKILEFLSVKNY